LRYSSAVSKPLIALGILVALALGAWVRLDSQPGGPPWTQDEWSYAHRAGLIAREGPAKAFPALVAEYNSAPAWWHGPSPLRAGYLVLLAGRLQPAGTQVTAEDLRAGARLSAWISVLNLLLLALLAWKALGPEAAVLAAVLMLASPLDLLIARRSWQDGLFAGASLLLASAVLLRRQRPSASTALAVVAAACWACLVKESALVTAALLAVWAAGASWAVREGAWATRRLPVFLLLGLGILAASFLTARLAGGAAPAWTAFTHAREEFSSLEPLDRIPQALPEGTVPIDGLPMISDPNSRVRPPGTSVLTGLWALSPLSLVLGLAGMAWALGRCLGSRQRLAEAPTALAWLLAGSLALGILHPNSLRLMAPADLLLHAMSGWAVWEFLKGTPHPRRALAAATAVMALIALADWSNFRTLVSRGVSDPGIPAVVARTMYPTPR